MHATNGISLSSEDRSFKRDLYIGKLRDIGIMRRQEHWLNNTFKDVRHQSYDYFLRDSLMWKMPKRKRIAIESGG